MENIVSILFSSNINTYNKLPGHFGKNKIWHLKHTFLLCETLKCGTQYWPWFSWTTLLVIFKTIYLFILLRLMFPYKTYQLLELQACAWVCVDSVCMYSVCIICPVSFSIFLLLNIDIFHCFSEDKSVSVIFGSICVFNLKLH